MEAEGVARGLFKGSIPMLTLGVTQALVVAMQRHIRFVRRVELSRSVLAPLGGSISANLCDLSSGGGGGGGMDAGSTGSLTCDGGSDLGGGGLRRKRLGGDIGAEAYLAAANPWSYVYQLARVALRHPFELLGVRLVTSPLPEYASFWRGLWHHLRRDWTCLFSGIRQSLFNAVCLPRASHHVLLLGVPTLLHARRMLPPAFQSAAHAGLGGSVELLASLVRAKGFRGLLVAASVSLDILPWAAASVLSARALGWLLLGPSREAAERARIRTAYLSERLQKRGSRGGRSGDRGPSPSPPAPVGVTSTTPTVMQSSDDGGGGGFKGGGVLKKRANSSNLLSAAGAQ